MKSLKRLVRKLTALVGLRVVRRIGFGLSRKLAGQEFFFDPATVIGGELLRTGQFESDAVSVCASFIRPDGIVIDVGANIGVHTVQFAAFAPRGKILSFEPARSTFQYLLRNVQKLANVIPLNLGLSDSAGLKLFFVAVDNAYSGLKDTNRKTIVSQESIVCIAGDDLLPKILGHERVDLIKIDVEGFEMEVLQGLHTLISTQRPIIFCEIFGGQHSNPDPQGTVEFCTSLGYDAFVLDGAKLRPARVHDDEYYNYFFIPKGSALPAVCVA